MRNFKQMWIEKAAPKIQTPLFLAYKTTIADKDYPERWGAGTVATDKALPKLKTLEDAIFALGASIETRMARFGTHDAQGGHPVTVELWVKNVDKNAVAKLVKQIMG